MTLRDELFERALAGELARDGEELARLRRDDPEAARELDELLALQGALEAQELPSAAAQPTDDDRRRVEETLGRLAAAGAPRRRPRAMAPWAAAAAVLLALGAFVLVRLVGGDGNGGPDLGDPVQLEAVSPTGAVADYVEFRVEGELPGLAVSQLFVWDANAPEGSDALLRPKFRGAVWTCPEARRELLPASILWKVEVRDSSGHLVAHTETIRAERE